MSKRIWLGGINWAQALTKVMASSDLKTQAALARKSGIAQSTIGRILRGEVNPQSVNLERIAKALKIPLAKLAELAQPGMPAPDLRRIENVPPVALISWEQAGSLADTFKELHHDWMPRPKDAGDRTFALRVRGESMEPSYQHGDVIFVDPDIALTHGRDVIAWLYDSSRVVFKRLVVEGAREYLKPVNPHWPDKIIEVAADPGARIIGVVMGKWAER